jgi:hypothetical protein
VQYLLMIYHDEEQSAAADDDVRVATLAEYERFNLEQDARGVLLGGAELQPSYTATSVRVRDGEVLLTDGPFAETREQLGGYYVVECDSIDEVVQVAAAIPGASYGTIEVRPLVEGSGPSGR